jgi:hypothetical protein
VAAKRPEPTMPSTAMETRATHRNPFIHCVITYLLDLLLLKGFNAKVLKER